MTYRTLVVILTSLLLFMVSQITVFTLFDVTPDEMPSFFVLFMICITLILLSFGVGILMLIVERPTINTLTILILCGILGVISFTSLFQVGSKWSQLASMFLFIPSIYLGRLYALKKWL